MNQQIRNTLLNVFSHALQPNHTTQFLPPTFPIIDIPFSYLLCWRGWKWCIEFFESLNVWMCVCMVLQKATREQAVVLSMTWLYIGDVILRMDAKFLSNFAFSGTLFPTYYSNSIWCQFYIRIILGSDFHTKGNNATTEIKERVGRKKNGGYLLEYVIPKQTEWFPYFPWRKLTSLYLRKENPMLLAVFLWSSHWGMFIFSYFSWHP